MTIIPEMHQTIDIVQIGWSESRIKINQSIVENGEILNWSYDLRTQFYYGYLYWNIMGGRNLSWTLTGI